MSHILDFLWVMVVAAWETCHQGKTAEEQEEGLL